MAENALTKVARIASSAAQGAKYTDSDGKVKIIKPTGDQNYIDLSGLNIGSNSGGNTGGGDNPDHPSSGADYYAGSLSDGEITERKLLWQGSTDPTKVNNLTLVEDVGAKFNMAGDGAMYLVHIQKTVMTAGVKGATSVLQLNYDPNNAAKEGYFTTTSVYPIYISTGNLSTHQELVVPINGIGENLSGKNVKAPELHVTFKDDKTMDISTVTGYNNDGANSGATGANYDIVVEVVSTFSTQKAVAQLPASINLFTGSASGNIALSGSSDYYENVMDGLEITLDPYLYSSSTVDRMTLGRTPISNFDIDKVIRIPKEYLVDGYANYFKAKDSPSLETGMQGTSTVGQESWFNINYPLELKFLGYNSTKLKISSQGIDLELSVALQNGDNGGYSRNTFTAKIDKVTPYKK